MSQNLLDLTGECPFVISLMIYISIVFQNVLLLEMI